MTEEEYAAIERRVIDTDPRPVTAVPTLDVERRQGKTVEAIARAIRGQERAAPPGHFLSKTTRQVIPPRGQ
jgi:hypothetical protein